MEWRVVLAGESNNTDLLQLIRWLNEKKTRRLLEKYSSSYVIVADEDDINTVKAFGWVGCVISEQQYKSFKLRARMTNYGK